MRTLILALILPTIVTWMYFIALAESEPRLQQAAYLIGKTIQFLLPIIWVCRYRREQLAWSKMDIRDVLLGLAFGCAVLTAAVLVYHGYLKPGGYLEGATDQIQEKVADLAGTSTLHYWLLSAFYVVIHSFLEEYYWRWYVAAELRKRSTHLVSIGVSSMGFTAHHVLLLAHYFGWSSPLTYFFSVCVLVGGVFWAWLYLRGKSIFGPWLSHLLVDLAIFVVGYDIVRHTLTPT